MYIHVHTIQVSEYVSTLLPCMTIYPQIVVHMYIYVCTEYVHPYGVQYMLMRSAYDKISTSTYRYNLWHYHTLLLDKNVFGGRSALQLGKGTECGGYSIEFGALGAFGESGN